MIDRVREIAYVVVLFRRQWEAEKTRLVMLSAFGGGVGASAFSNALDHKWAAAIVGLVLALVAAALFEWRWSVAMRVPGSDKEDPHG